MIGPYVVDFCCLEHRLAIEVDGTHHSTEEVAVYDAERFRYLESMGFRVIRFSNHEVLRELPKVIAEIAALGASFAPNQPQSPTPCPSAELGG